MERYICIHAHFYQPPRENPWLETFGFQKSALPYHDWNQRITTECYRPNTMARILDGEGRISRIINNYSRISFNFGPTLLSWLADKDPETYSSIIEADKESRARFSGHGSAIAQAYNHAILPLCNPRDKFTQIQWGIRDFVRRFGRQPESMWIPETAADLETLDLMAQAGLKFAILAPHQARRVRKKEDRAWHDIDNQIIDPSMAYEICLPSGRRMVLFFYDGPISLSVGFEKLLGDGVSFVNRLTGAFSSEKKWPQLIHIATDGETYGHHHRFGEMALAYALHTIESGIASRLTNYGEYLEKHPPTHVVEIWENKSWSCPHGIGRWEEDCGCGTGSNPGWQQEWRAPLRKALNWLRDNLADLYAANAIPLLKYPWAARNDYIDVILDRSPDSVKRFLHHHSVRELGADEQIKALKMLELQRHALLMFTSCGWYFDDISGIEAIQILQYAGRAIQLGEELSGKKEIESAFLEILRSAQSNDPDFGNGRDIYKNFVKPAMIDQTDIVGHYAACSLFENYPKRSEFYSYRVDQTYSKTGDSGKAKLAMGRCIIASQITTEISEAEYAIMHSGDGTLSGRVKECLNDSISEAVTDEIVTAFNTKDMQAASRLIDQYYGPCEISLSSLYVDEKERILGIILEEENKKIETLIQRVFNHVAPIMRSLLERGLPPPETFANIAKSVIYAKLLHAFQAERFNDTQITELFKEAEFWRIELKREKLEAAFRQRIEKLAKLSRDNPGDLPSLRNFAAAVDLASKLSFKINYYETQNIYYKLLKNTFHKLKTSEDPAAVAWTELFKELGKKLSFEVKG